MSDFDYKNLDAVLADLLEIYAVIEPRVRALPDVVTDAYVDFRAAIDDILDREMAVDVIENAIERLRMQRNVDALVAFAGIMVDRARRTGNAKWF